ncbi:MAG: hypothetical protein Ct9H300mP19_16150 [Dehalococcoidia bacterium]|nr:MAG: hypothetical protein Ct9H300mP19_16150 [Dehalococcoidia bacterium]
MSESMTSFVMKKPKRRLVIKSLGQKASWHPADIGDTQDRERMLAEFVRARSLDILVNNAVASRICTLRDYGGILGSSCGTCAEGIPFPGPGAAGGMIEHNPVAAS